jgi:trk system potassium uptake protein TrkA
MKRFVVIGLGNFGASLVETLREHGHEVIVVDGDEDAVDAIGPSASVAVVGDGKSVDTLRRVGAAEADCGIINTGDDLASSVLATLALQELGVPEIRVKVVSTEHARAMERLGATETVFPERVAAQNLGVRLSGRGLKKFVSLGDGHSLQEMAVPAPWKGRTLVELDLRREHSISVVAIRNTAEETLHLPPDPNRALVGTDSLLVAGRDEDLEKVAELK